MFNRIHQKLGTAGFIISIVALVAALGGGAYAANGGSAARATASAKAKQGKQGKPGKTGPAGPAGAQGPVGPAGPKGDTGSAGANGSNGASGATGATGVRGATGPTGASGQTGFTETLPSGKTETGTWSLRNLDETEGEDPVSISFPIPLSTSVEAVYLDKEETLSEAETDGCKWEQGNADAKPEAPAGKLCVFTVENTAEREGEYTFFETPGSPGIGPIAAPSGVFLIHNVTGQVLKLGTWAVTAP